MDYLKKCPLKTVRTMFLRKIDTPSLIKRRIRPMELKPVTIKMEYITDVDESLTIQLRKKVDCLDDLIELSKMYVPGWNYNIDMYRLHKIQKPMQDLRETIGLRALKKDIIKQILFFLQDFRSSNDDMLHTVIYGSPGVGKTLVGQIIGELYHKLGVIKSKGNEYKFKIIKRSDLIGQYLGTTAKKTQEVIDSCIGGVMFIDEAYSLGNSGKQDIYAKECIDTLNQNLTEKKGQFMCIIAGYEKDLDECFFRYNEGLRRRFSFVYGIDKYSVEELVLIFKSMMATGNWKLNIDDSDIVEVFTDHADMFINQAGDIETLVFHCKLEHSTRVFCENEDMKNKITKDDISAALEVFKKTRKIDKLEEQRSAEDLIMKTLYS